MLSGNNLRRYVASGDSLKRPTGESFGDLFSIPGDNETG
jgi:hypothetical protein